MAIYLGVDNNGTFVSSDGQPLLDSNGLTLTAIPISGKLKFVFNGISYRVNVKLPKKESE